MPQKTLPPSPDLDHLRRQARDLQKARYDGDLSADQWIREFHPRPKEPFTLADAQLTVARLYGYPSWARLKSTLEKGEIPNPDIPFEDRIVDPLFRQTVALIDAGDAEGLRAQLTAHPSLVRRRAYFHAGVYFGNPTLLAFVAENPVRHERTPPNVVEIARVLLDAGADANDGTLGLVATGRLVREGGVQIALIDLFCERGADPAGPMAGCLVHGEFEAAEALLRHGAPLDLPTAAALDLTKDVRRLLPGADADARHLALALSAQYGRLEPLRRLLDVDEEPSRYNPPGAHSHSTPVHQAAVAGHLDAVRLLVEYGARLDLRDTLWSGTPLEWAEHGGQAEVAEYLRGFRR